MRLAALGPLRPIWHRLPQLLLGLTLFGAGLGLVVRGGLGEGPWTVFHEGVSLHTPMTIGTVTILTGLILVLGLIRVNEPIGIGTLVNVVFIGIATDVTLFLVDEPGSQAGRVLFTLASPLLVAVGSGLYLGVRLGPGPRDGVMTALQRAGMAIWMARFLIEVIPFTIGALLGGTVGWGTVYWLVVIGPTVHLCMTAFERPAMETRWTDVFGATAAHD